MYKQNLHSHWTARAVSNFSEVPSKIKDAHVPAQVPGCIHTDLMCAGLIDDPYIGLNEPKLLWIGNTDWQYTTTFDADAKLFDHERIDLVADGLDTIATIALNGHEVAKTINMHRGYRFDVRKHLKKGRNELTITFAACVPWAAAMEKKMGPLPMLGYGGHFNFIRKMACNMGWDWGPIVPTCGIWKGILLEAWTGFRISSIQTTVSREKQEWLIDVAIKYEGRSTEADETPQVYLSGKDRKVIHCETDDTATLFSARIVNPDIWWPAGHGNPDLYTLAIEGDQMIYKKIGLRTVELDSSPDEIGRKFVLKVNGQPIFCKGFNWIPDDCFPDRANDPVRLRKRIQQALDCNGNMLRVWGGGIYETDAFYDICDEMGMMVWQDFLFACAAYPEEEPIKSEVEAEVRYNVARLAHHPSLVLWNGCNENIWGYHVWGGKDANGERKSWKDLLVGKTWGAGYYLDLLPKIVKELDPSRPYWAASPWSGDTDVDNGLHPNLSTHGNKHIWEVWHGPGDYNNYRWFSPRFCSEFGYQGPANYSTFAKFFAPEEMKRGSETMTLHQKSPGGNDRNDRLLQKDFDIPENFDDWHYLLQINQARAITAGCEWFRSRQPVCMGTLYWQFNDCYPVTSWSAVDSEGRLKPLYFATRKFYRPQLLTIQPEADAFVLYANNDAPEPWKGDVIVRRMSFDGKELAKITVPINAAPWTNLRAAILPVSVMAPRDKSREFVVASIGNNRTTWYFAPDRDLAYPQPEPSVSVEKSSDGYRVNMSSKTLLRDVVINVDRLDPEAVVSDSFTTILPGESVTFDIHTSKTMSADQLKNPPVFQCANRFGKK